MREGILLVIGSVTANQYEEARTRLMRMGYKPKVQRVSEDQMTFIDWDQLIVDDESVEPSDLDFEGAVLSQMGIKPEMVLGAVVPVAVWLNSDSVFNMDVLNSKMDVVHIIHRDGSVEVAR